MRAESAKPARFSGHPKDFRNFERDLQIYLNRWMSVDVNALSECMKLDILEEVLDAATSKMLQEWRLQQPQMTFVEAWRQVRKTFGDVVVGGARQEWRALNFEYSGKPSTSIVAWRNFCADFCRLQKQVPDCSEGEAADFLRERLPHAFLREIDREESRRRKQNGTTVRLCGLLPVGSGEAGRLVQRTPSQSVQSSPDLLTPRHARP